MKTVVILTRPGHADVPFCSFVYNHAKALVQEGCKVYAIVLSNYFPFVKKKREEYDKVIDGINVIYRNRLSFSNLLHDSPININAYSYYIKAKKEIKKILKKEKIDLIDAHFFKIEGYAAAMLRKKYGINTFVTLHGTSFDKNFKNKYGRKQIIWVSHHINSYICVSNKIYNQLDSINISNKEIIYDGINYYKVKRDNINHNICTLGGLIPIKNIDYVINEFYKVCKKYSDSQLYIIGDGPLKNDLEKLCKEKNIENKVHFLGQISNDEVYNIFSKCNIFSLISKPEGFGISYCEAMYSGCISIGTKGEGIDGFIKNGENGFVIDLKENSLYQLIDKIFADDYEYVRKNGIKSVKNMTWKDNAQKYLDILK